MVLRVEKSMQSKPEVALDGFREELVYLDGRAGDAIRKMIASGVIQLAKSPLPGVSYDDRGIAATPTKIAVDISRAKVKDLVAAVKAQFPEAFGFSLFGIRLW
jgi:hypothetical protein